VRGKTRGNPFLPVILLALLLAACAAPRPPAPEVPLEPPVAYPAELRERLVTLALQEWQAFGAGVTDRSGTESVELRPALPQEDPRVFHLVQGYWNAVREERPEWEDHVAAQRALRRQGSGEVWRSQPWSAAFVSYLLRSAGVDRADFAWSAAHRVYLDHAILASQRWGELALYTPLELEAHAPRPGDLVCGDRTRAPEPRLPSLAARAAELGTPRGMHCDLVVASEPGRLVLVGGNLGNAVRMIYLPLEADGRLRRRAPGEAPGATPFAVLRLNVPEPSPPLLSERAK